MRFVGSNCNISVMILTWGKIEICLKIGHKKAEFEYLFLIIIMMIMIERRCPGELVEVDREQQQLRGTSSAALLTKIISINDNFVNQIKRSEQCFIINVKNKICTLWLFWLELGQKDATWAWRF